MTVRKSKKTKKTKTFKDHNGKTLTAPQVAMLRQWAKEGEVYPDRPCDHVTRSSLRDRGLIEWHPALRQLVLSHAGLSVCLELFPRTKIHDPTDPFRGERCGVPQDVHDAHMAWYVVDKDRQERADACADQRLVREGLVAYKLRAALETALGNTLPVEAVQVMRTIAKDGRCGYTVRVRCTVQGKNASSYDEVKIDRHAFVTDDEELCRFGFLVHEMIAQATKCVVKALEKTND